MTYLKALDILCNVYKNIPLLSQFCTVHRHRLFPYLFLSSRRQRGSNRGGGGGKAFDDRNDARLILELEKTLLASPNFDLGRFRSSLEAKDAYGNDQVSRQHVSMAASAAGLNIDRPTLGLLLQASDPTGKGIYHISALCDYLERSDPALLEMRSNAGSAASSKREWRN